MTSGQRSTDPNGAGSTRPTDFGCTPESPVIEHPEAGDTWSGQRSSRTHSPLPEHKCLEAVEQASGREEFLVSSSRPTLTMLSTGRLLLPTYIHRASLGMWVVDGDFLQPMRLAVSRFCGEI